MSLVLVALSALAACSTTSAGSTTSTSPVAPYASLPELHGTSNLDGSGLTAAWPTQVPTPDFGTFVLATAANHTTSRALWETPLAVAEAVGRYETSLSDRGFTRTSARRDAHTVRSRFERDRYIVTVAASSDLGLTSLTVAVRRG